MPRQGETRNTTKKTKKTKKTIGYRDIAKAARVKRVIPIQRQVESCLRQTQACMGMVIGFAEKMNALHERTEKLERAVLALVRTSEHLLKTRHTHEPDAAPQQPKPEETR